MLLSMSSLFIIYLLWNTKHSNGLTFFIRAPLCFLNGRGNGFQRLFQPDLKHGYAQRLEEQGKRFSNGIMVRQITASISCPGNEENQRNAIDRSQAGQRIDSIPNTGTFHKDQWMFSGQRGPHSEGDSIVFSRCRHIPSIHFRAFKFSNESAESRVRDPRDKGYA